MAIVNKPNKKYKTQINKLYARMCIYQESVIALEKTIGNESLSRDAQLAIIKLKRGLRNKSLPEVDKFEFYKPLYNILKLSYHRFWNNDVRVQKGIVLTDIVTILSSLYSNTNNEYLFLVKKRTELIGKK